MFSHNPHILTAVISTLMAVASASAIGPQQESLGQAKAVASASAIEVSTGRISRAWKWTGAGWLTTAVRDLDGGREYSAPVGFACDWNLPGKLEDKTVGELVDCRITQSDDDGFSSKYLEVVSTVNYPAAALVVQHVIWVYPGATGIRTQLRVKAMDGYKPAGATAADQTVKSFGGTIIRPGARVDLLPLDFSVRNHRRYWGIFNDPGNRLHTSMPMLEEKVIHGFPLFQPEAITWASGEAVDFDGAGVMVVKESPKAVNQMAHLTGGFFSGAQGLQVTGWGLAPEEILPDRFRDSWATWTIVYSGDNDGMQRALKEFDAVRYPVMPERDAIILSNTWGPANPGGAQFTAEDVVLKEIPALAELGVDALQIDDGWQKAGGGPGASNFLPKYTNGWKDIKAAADKHDIRLGLWVAIRNANLDDLKTDIDQLGYVTWKADFDHLANRGDYEARIAKYRAVMKHAWGKTQFTLCPEYDDPRYGWYYCKEYGSIYFQNIQENLPAHLTFVPFQVLRQHWFMAKYFPSNKLQVMLQNPKRVNAGSSDANQHGHGYCFAMGLPFVPCFFQLAENLDAGGKQEIKAIIAAYKNARADIFTSTTYPIGDEPDNASWTGFQMTSTSTANTGHLLVFRELHNPQATAKVRLKFLAGKSLAVTNLLTGENSTLAVAADGTTTFTIPQAADFRLLHYRVR